MHSVAFDILEDEIFEIDVVRGALNGAKHRAKGYRTIAQEPGAVSGDQRTLGYRFLDRDVTLEDTGVAGLSADAVQQRLALLCGERPACANDLGLRRQRRHSTDILVDVRYRRAAP